MNSNEKDDIFAQKAREAFLASTATLSPGVLARLRESRRLAVEAVGAPKPLWQPQGWQLPAGALALVCVVVVAGALWTGGLSTPPANASFTAANTDAPIMLTGDNLDMYADMDFYQWLESQDQPAPKTDPADDNDDDESDDDSSGVGG